MNAEYLHALDELKNWILNNKTIIETTSFGKNETEEVTFNIQSVSIQDIEIIKELTNNCLPDSYYYFLQEIGVGAFFIGEYSSKFELYNIIQLKEYNALIQQEIEGEDEITKESYFMIGSHRSMGDWMGFCTSKSDLANFDVYCHEYPIYDYAAISDELKSWRSFEDWIINVVKTKGEDSL
jgi:hypothetical protein